ncbi:hypothetical protein A9986_02795 [Solibacillus silvestris]|nr:hypothetical protein [Solibacillus silvestris]OBW60124.1 hypothetical protein A9986_02795 [Solibacillus silvestris]
MGWQQLQQQAEQYHIQLLETEKLSKKIESLEHQIQYAEQNVEQYERDLQNTRQQLNKLEEFSFVNLFRGWSGKKDELIEQNMDSVAVTELKLVEAQLTFKDLQEDRIKLVQQLSTINVSQIREQLKKIEDEKQVWLMANAPAAAKELTSIIEQEILCKQLKIEIHEAIDAGKQAFNKLTDAGSQLQDAKSYSTWDTFLGGGFIATALKHDKLEETNSYLHEAQMALQRFQNELLDIKEIRQKTLEVHTDGFVMFTDYFFDNIFTDWSIHSKITTAIDQILRVQDDVANTLRDLKQKLSMTIEKEQALLIEKESILNADDQSLFFQK